MKTHLITANRRHPRNIHTTSETACGLIGEYYGRNVAAEIIAIDERDEAYETRHPGRTLDRSACVKCVRAARALVRAFKEAAHRQLRRRVPSIVVTNSMALACMGFFFDMQSDALEALGLPTPVVAAVTRYDLSTSEQGKRAAVYELRHTIEAWHAADRDRCMDILGHGLGL